MPEKLKETYLKYKMFTLSVAVATASLLVIILVVVPQILTFISVRSKILSVYDKTSRFQVKAAELDQVDEAIYLKDLQVALAALPQERDIPESLIVIQSLIIQNSLLLEDARVLAIAPGSSTNSFQMVITVFGPLSQIKSFLTNVANSPRVLKVETISAQSVRGGLEGEIALSLYFDPSKPAIASADTPLPKLSQEEEALLGKLSKAAISQIVSTIPAVPIGKVNPFE